MTDINRPTLVAIIADPHEAGGDVGAVVAVAGWQGVRTVLVTLTGAEDERLRAIQQRAATTLIVESAFHWATAAIITERLARVLQAFQPQAIIASTKALGNCRPAWEMATDETVIMPTLRPLQANRARLWQVTDANGDARLDVSASRAVARAVGYYYRAGEAWASLRAEADDEPSPYIEFAWVAGAPPGDEHPVTSLWAGSTDEEMAPISFLV